MSLPGSWTQEPLDEQSKLAKDLARLDELHVEVCELKLKLNSPDLNDTVNNLEGPGPNLVKISDLVVRTCELQTGIIDRLCSSLKTSQEANNAIIRLRDTKIAQLESLNKKQAKNIVVIVGRLNHEREKNVKLMSKNNDSLEQVIMLSQEKSKLLQQLDDLDHKVREDRNTKLEAKSKKEDNYGNSLQSMARRTSNDTMGSADTSGPEQWRLSLQARAMSRYLSQMGSTAAPDAEPD